MRPLTLNQQRAMRRGNDYRLMYEVDHPAGYVRAHSGTGVIEFDSANWLPTYGIMQLEGTELSDEVSLQEFTATLSGIDKRFTGDLEEKVRGRKGRLHYAYLDDDGVVVDGLIPLQQFELQFSSVEADEEALTYSLSGAGGILQIRSPTRQLNAPEYVKADYPDESGFDFVETIQSNSAIWTQSELR